MTLVVGIGGEAEPGAGGQQRDGGGCAARLHLHQFRLPDAGALWGQGASEDHRAVRSRQTEMASGELAAPNVSSALVTLACKTVSSVSKCLRVSNGLQHDKIMACPKGDGGAEERGQGRWECDAGSGEEAGEAGCRCD